MRERYASLSYSVVLFQCDNFLITFLRIPPGRGFAMNIHNMKLSSCCRTQLNGPLPSVALTARPPEAKQTEHQQQLTRFSGCFFWLVAGAVVAREPNRTTHKLGNTPTPIRSHRRVTGIFLCWVRVPPDDGDDDAASSLGRCVCAFGFSMNAFPAE